MKVNTNGRPYQIYTELIRLCATNALKSNSLTLHISYPQIPIIQSSTPIQLPVAAMTPSSSHHQNDLPQPHQDLSQSHLTDKLLSDANHMFDVFNGWSNSVYLFIRHIKQLTPSNISCDIFSIFCAAVIAPRRLDVSHLYANLKLYIYILETFYVIDFVLLCLCMQMQSR